ncbi:hypothetical protein J2Y48_002510 [Mycoplana sp. BE70]|uniref:DUF3168 domain-containing protein n=1 Tax=Mycoplana sp. BE70 TaxID=2817775 RepID=UPI002863B17C|nr:DUF3168 domain-containing protein [Mycoplana sp. BE70]MDR6757214.1 hypothetical protein [Mycoplana sp. BE70]
MRSAASTLQKAIHQRLSEDAALTALIGVDGVCDRLLDRQRMPLVVIEAVESRNLSTSTDEGEEHWLTLVAWSKGGGHLEVQTIVARVRALLDNADLTLDGCHLVSLLHRSTRIARDGTKALHRAEMRFRAVTE